MTTKSSTKGFTLTEVLVVVAILAILAILTIFNFNQQKLKAEDAKAKSDVFSLKIAFENYYNDHACYPPPTWFDSPDDCGSNQLLPYLSSIPCDKNTGKPYVLETDETGCKWFKLYATFSLPSADDMAVSQRSSTGSNKGNFGVSSSNVVVSVYYQTPSSSPAPPSPTPTPSVVPSPLPQNHDYYWCSNLGNCTIFDKTLYICTPYYTDNPNCDGGNNKCSSVGSCTHL